LMTFHPKNSESSSQYFQNAAWLDFNMLQSGHHGIDVPNDEMIARDYAARPIKPCLDAEPCYENHPVKTPGWRERDDRFGDYDARKAAYRALFAGAFGHTYGCHDIWMFWEPDGDFGNHVGNTIWTKALQFPGAGQMQYARALLESKPFLSRIPDQSLILESDSTLYATRDETNTYALIYFPKKAAATIDLRMFSGQPVRASWFDTRDGSVQEMGNINAAQQEFQSPATKVEEDWVLVLDKIE